MDILHHAFDYQDRGFSFLPVNGKKPAIESWKHLMERKPTHGEIVAWFGRVQKMKGTKQGGNNIGIICGRISRILVLDADSLEIARDLYRLLPKTVAMSKTGKGVHFLYQIRSDQIVPPRVRIGGRNLDVRGEGSYIVAPPSIHPNGAAYRWINEDWQLASVPYFDESWIERVCGPNACPSNAPHSSVSNGPAYISQIRAISGQGGHNATFRAACKLCDAGLSESEALAAMIEWNETSAEPPWTVKELLHKVRSAFSKNASA